MIASTLRVPTRLATTLGIPTQWHGALEILVMWSIMLGIEQAKRNEGTFLDDADLATDDDDE